MLYGSSCALTFFHMYGRDLAIYKISECQFKNKTQSLLAGNMSWDVVYLLSRVLSCPSRVLHSMSIALSWALLPFALPPFLSQPHGPEGEREGRLSFRNINYSLEIRTCSHIQCWFWASLCLGSPHCILFGLSVNEGWHTVICAHTVYSLSVRFSLIIQNMTGSHFPLTEYLITIQLTPLVGFLLRSGGGKNTELHFLFEVVKAHSMVTNWQEVRRQINYPRQFSVFLVCSVIACGAVN